jgi:peptidoglycan/LPS O-acetylase OafA/YrhL
MISPEAAMLMAVAKSSFAKPSGFTTYVVWAAAVAQSERRSERAKSMRVSFILALAVDGHAMRALSYSLDEISPGEGIILVCLMSTCVVGSLMKARENFFPNKGSRHSKHDES